MDHDTATDVFFIIKLIKNRYYSEKNNFFLLNIKLLMLLLQLIPETSTKNFLNVLFQNIMHLEHFETFILKLI